MADEVAVSARTWISAISLLVSLFSLGVSIANSRRIAQIKSLDLLLELRKLRTQTDLTLNELPDLIRNAIGQRCETASFVGLTASGWLDSAKAQSQKDLAEVARLKHQRSSAAGDESKLDAQALSNRLAQEHGIQRVVTCCEERYRTWLADDLERSREERARRDEESRMR